MERLERKELNVEIKKRKILKNVSLNIKKGETLTIIGESGSGKTMLSKLLVGSKPENSNISGEILFDDENYLNLSVKEWMEKRGKQIAYISQNPMAIFNDFQTIESHVIELYQSHFQISKKECIQKIKEAFLKVNLDNVDEVLKKYPFQLSGGMLQRIMFAMMFELNPEVLIVDEPTSALDIFNTNKIIELLLNFQKENKILIIITHDYEMARKLIGKMIVIKNGEIIEEGLSEEILSNPKTEYGKQLILREKYRRYNNENYKEEF